MHIIMNIYFFTHIYQLLNRLISVPIYVNTMILEDFPEPRGGLDAGRMPDSLHFANTSMYATEYVDKRKIPENNIPIATRFPPSRSMTIISDLEMRREDIRNGTIISKPGRRVTIDQNDPRINNFAFRKHAQREEDLQKMVRESAAGKPVQKVDLSNIKVGGVKYSTSGGLKHEEQRGVYVPTMKTPVSRSAVKVTPIDADRKPQFVEHTSVLARPAMPKWGFSTSNSGSSIRIDYHKSTEAVKVEGQIVPATNLKTRARTMESRSINGTYVYIDTPPEYNDRFHGSGRAPATHVDPVDTINLVCAADTNTTCNPPDTVRDSPDTVRDQPDTVRDHSDTVRDQPDMGNNLQDTDDDPLFNERQDNIGQLDDVNLPDTADEFRLNTNIDGLPGDLPAEHANPSESVDYNNLFLHSVVNDVVNGEECEDELDKIWDQRYSEDLGDL